MNDPQMYTKTNKIQTRDAIQYLESQSGRLKWTKDEVVLDVGCGPGNLTNSTLVPFLPSDAAVVGCDISEDMINYAKSNYSGHRFTYKRMNIEDENLWNDWTKEEFNKIFSFYCLHWVEDKRQAAKNMYSLLKPGGEIFLLFLTHNPMYILFADITKFQKWKTYFKGFNQTHEKVVESVLTQEEYKQVFYDGGFQYVDVKIIRNQYWYPSFDVLMAYIEPLDPYIKNIPLALKEDYIATLKDLTLKNNLAYVEESSGIVRGDYELVYVYAKKSA